MSSRIASSQFASRCSRVIARMLLTLVEANSAVKLWAVLPLPALVTKKPYSGARIGPLSKSRGKNVKLPDWVQTVILVSRGWP